MMRVSSAIFVVNFDGDIRFINGKMFSENAEIYKYI